MALATTITATTTHEVKLRPALQRKLRAELAAYAELKAQITAWEMALEDHKTAIDTLREEAGEDKLELDGFKITRVTSTQKKLNHQKLIALGCAASWILEATEEIPKRPYCKITLPGVKDREE